MMICDRDQGNPFGDEGLHDLLRRSPSPGIVIGSWCVKVQVPTRPDGAKRIACHCRLSLDECHTGGRAQTEYATLGARTTCGTSADVVSAHVTDPHAGAWYGPLDGVSPVLSIREAVLLGGLSITHQACRWLGSGPVDTLGRTGGLRSQRAGGSMHSLPAAVPQSAMYGATARWASRSLTSLHGDTSVERRSHTLRALEVAVPDRSDHERTQFALTHRMLVQTQGDNERDSGQHHECR